MAKRAGGRAHAAPQQPGSAPEQRRRGVAPGRGQLGGASGGRLGHGAQRVCRVGARCGTSRSSPSVYRPGAWSASGVRAQPVRGRQAHPGRPRHRSRGRRGRPSPTWWRPRASWLRPRHARRGPQPRLPAVPVLRRARGGGGRRRRRTRPDRGRNAGGPAHPLGRAVARRPSGPPPGAPADRCPPWCCATATRRPARPPRARDRCPSWPTASPPRWAGPRWPSPTGAAGSRRASSRWGLAGRHRERHRLRRRGPAARDLAGRLRHRRRPGRVRGRRRRAGRGRGRWGRRADFDDWAGHPRRLLEHGREVGVITDPSFPPTFDAWSRELRGIRAVAASAATPPPAAGGPRQRRRGGPPFDARVVADAHGSAELRFILGAGHALRHDPERWRCCWAGSTASVTPPPLSER